MKYSNAKTNIHNKTMKTSSGLVVGKRYVAPPVIDSEERRMMGWGQPYMSYECDLVQRALMHVEPTFFQNEKKMTLLLAVLVVLIMAGCKMYDNGVYNA